MADSNTRHEKEVKWIAAWLYLIYIAMWTFLVAYQYLPRAAVVLNLTGYLGMILVPVQLYRLICTLSRTERLTPFSLWHYALPVGIVGLLAVWSVFVPYDVQSWLLENRGVPDPGRPAYSQLFLSKPLMRLLFSIVYFPLCIVRLYRYYRETNRGRKRAHLRRPANWVWVVMACVVLVMAVTFMQYIYPRGVFITRWCGLIAAFVIVAEHAVIGYHIISRNFLLYARPEGEEEDETPAKRRCWRPSGSHGKTSAGSEIAQPQPSPRTQPQPQPQPQTRLTLTRKTLDHYMKTDKPWLDPSFRITDLTETFAASRNTVSAFVNRTYGVNFSRYLNRLRLQEMERLVVLPSSASKTRAELALLAGFANDRGYRRAAEAEKNPGNGNGTEGMKVVSENNGGDD
ncbi:hypothetical protein [Bacteroides sp. UBA939]|uniref:hypothetical protein n=1 Tax=Bacteroides sp. UBA939 TaxID=1946092 RepID=UPI0025C53E22|nr:hypothetical protein [Bacteroides sp. UBA939]